MVQQSTPGKLIAVMGLTGTGKTTFINRLSGANLETNDGLRSCTKSIAIASINLEGHEAVLIDTPGFDDTDVQDTDILKEIAAYLKLLSDEDQKLTGLLYFHNISQVRIGRSAAKNIRMFRALVGSGNMGNVILVTTRWDLVKEEKDATIKQRILELESDEGFWGAMMKAGARHETLKNVETDGRRILSRLLEKKPVEVKLQSQLRKGLSLHDTTAGQTLHDDLRKMEEKHRKEIEYLKEQLDEATRQNQDTDVAVLKNELEQAAREREKYQQELIALKDAEIHRLQAENARLHLMGGGGSCCIV
ncbi:P-loop containing nucleoside triphosphate hydrolase protein, partial [Biscogniauxia sp. FL1348]